MMKRIAELRGGGSPAFVASLKRLAHQLPVLGAALCVTGLCAATLGLVERLTQALLLQGGDVTLFVTTQSTALTVAWVKLTAFVERATVFLAGS
jgi:hypothetical protein